MKHEEFKQTFWNWLKENTNFYVARGHHKKDIEDAISYTINKLKMKG